MQNAVHVPITRADLPVGGVWKMCYCSGPHLLASGCSGADAYGAKVGVRFL